MPVIFCTPTSHRVFMFDKDAAFMLNAMKTSGNIPGALFSEAVTGALESLKSRIELDANEEGSNEEDTEQSSANDNDSNYVGVNTKALPLIELMERAIEQNEKLMWDKG
ncbi:MAG: DUF1840 family protein [Cocleimonas sp.]